MGKISGEEGWIFLGPWGELSCEEYWDYKPDGPLMQITISYERVIDSVLFESKSYDGVVIGSSVKVGRTAGDGCWTKTFCIDSSVEQLSSISLTYDLNTSRHRPCYGAVNTLCFETNSGNKYGPFGERTGSYSLSIPIQGGVITGFHGRAGAGSGSWLNAIGIFVAPNINSLCCLGKKVDSLHSIQDPDSAPIQLKGKISDDEGFISLGPWGEKDGVDWTYKANGPIMQISICFGEVINSISFRSRSCDGLVIGSSEKFGGTGGHKTETFCINSAVEQLSSISLTYGDYNGQVAITALCFETNIGNKYGPFGWVWFSRASSLSIPIEGGVTVGFHGHGRTGNHLTSIGIFVLPKVNNLASSERKFDSLDSVKVPNYAPTQLKGKISDEEGFISLGPWGEKYGVDWTYKANGPIMQISISFRRVINSIFFRSRSCDGLVIGSSQKFGGTGGDTTKTVTFCINSAVEQLSSISLTYRDNYVYKDDNGQVAITSLCFETNIGNKYGPFGRISGYSHASLSIPIEGGVTVGFHGSHGRTGKYLTAIGIFVAPKVNNLASSERKFNSLDSVQEPNYAPTQVKGKISDDEGFISLGPWGEKYGGDWTYKANGPIMQISICFGEAINSIFFRSRSCDGLVIGSSEKFGGTGDHTTKTKTFFINSAVEQLSSISLTYGDYKGQVAITSLCFETNIGNKYGPFGRISYASSLSIPIEGGVIVGFHGHGRTGNYLTAIGIFVAPKVNNLASSERKFDSLDSVQEPNYVPTQLKQDASPRTSGRLSHSRPLNGGSLTDCPPLSPSEIDDKVLGSGVGSKPKTVETPTIKSKWSSRFLVANLKANFCGSKPKTLENIIIHNAASSSATTNKDDHHMNLDLMDSAFNNLNLVDSAFQTYKTHMGTEIREAREKLKEIKADPDKKDDHHGRALSPTSKMIHSGLILLDTAFAEAEESAHHIKVKINQAHEKFKKIKADPDKKELQKTIAKLKVQIPSHNKIRSANSNPHPKNWDNINGDKDGMTHFFHEEPEVAHTGDFEGLLKDFHDLPEPLRCCLSCFFKFPPMATIKRTSMIYLWIGQGYISEYLHSEGCVGDFEVHAGEIFDELIAKGFIEPIYQNCSLTPDSCKMSHSVRSSLYEEAKRRGFTSNGTLDLDLGFVCGGLDGHSCLINVGEAIISCEPKIFENMKHIRSLYLGRWQSSATHHIELTNAKILHRLNKLNSLTFLSLRGISMITELPAFKSKLKYDLMILDLRACHNLVVIPTNIGSLKSLTHLDMSQCYFLEHMPEGLAQLSNLQVLKGFLIGDFDNNKQSCTLRDLSELPKLRKLNIYISVKDFVKLQDLKYLESFESLKKLTISWGGCSLQARDEDIAKEFGVATLPPRLQKLDLQCFPMTSLTNWLMPGKLKELKKLYIRGGQLRDLGEIQKRQAERLTVEILQLKYLSKLELHWKELRTLFPKLIYLHQVECPNLFNFQCDERGMWVDHKAIDTHVLELHKACTCSCRNTSEPLA